jgi:uncharacterized membrane protein
MSETRSPLALAAGMGLVAGMRSMAAPALLSRRLSRLPGHGHGPAAGLLRSRLAATTFAALAAGEMIADKTPAVPDRTEPMSVLGRALMGALSGAAIAGVRGGSQTGGALVGATAAVGSTFLAYTLRARAGRNTGVPDVALALAEDLVVVGLGARIASAAVSGRR